MRIDNLYFINNNIAPIWIKKEKITSIGNRGNRVLGIIRYNIMMYLYEFKFQTIKTRTPIHNNTF